jgi:tripartite-type tricarboxylate transporter receptor subunit TctC
MTTAFTRRTSLCAFVAALAGPLSCVAAESADAWPSRPIKLTLGFPPGGNADALARLLANKLEIALGQPVVVENRPGATGTICSAYVAQVAPDGYVLQLAHVSSNAIGPLLLAHARFDPVKDFTPIGKIADTAQVLSVNPALGFKTVDDLIGHARANRGRLTYMSAGIGSSPHLAGAAFCSAAGIEMLHVPFKGTGEGMTALIGGQVDSTFSSLGASLPHVQSGRIKALGVCAPARLARLPELPAVAETLPGYQASTWYGLAGPARMPAALVARLERTLQAILRQPDVIRRMEELDADPRPGDSASFRAFWAEEVARYGRIIASSGIKV